MVKRYVDITDNFKYRGVSTDHETTTYCDGQTTDRCCGYRCRCGVINNAHITDIDVPQIIKNVIKTTNAAKIISDIYRYCIARVLNSFRIYDAASWDIKVVNGYYGEEIGGVYLQQAAQCQQALDELDELDDNKRVEHVLNLEYGYLLDSCKNRAWAVIDVKRDNCKLQQVGYGRKLSIDVIQRYEKLDNKLDLPIAVCLPVQRSADTYRVIDGYHRITASRDDTIKIICGYAAPKPV